MELPGTLSQELFNRSTQPTHVYERREGAVWVQIAANPAALELLGERSFADDAGVAPRLAAVLGDGGEAAFTTMHSGGTVACRAFALSGEHVALTFAAAVRDAEREALALKVKFLEAVIHHIPLPVFVKDARDLRYIEMNQAGLDFIGITREQLIGRSDVELEFLPPGVGELLTATDRKILESKQIVDVPEEPVPNPQGEVRLLRSLKVPLLGDTGEAQFLLGISEDITERRRGEEALRASEAELRIVQARLRETILELMTPALPILDGVLVAPLVGHLDTERSAQLMSALLSSVQHHRARVVIIDITGVPAVDSDVAGHLVRAARAVELLGARCVLAGISPRIAQTLVALGVDLGGIATLRDLQAAVAQVVAAQGRAAKK